MTDDMMFQIFRQLHSTFHVTPLSLGSLQISINFLFLKSSLISLLYEMLAKSVKNVFNYINIVFQGFATRGKEQEGRISYETGIATIFTFKEAQSTADPQTIILVEYTFLSQELEFCKTDKHALKCLTKAVQSFVDEHRRMISSYR